MFVAMPTAIAACAIDEQVWKFRRKNDRLALAAVIVCLKIDCLIVEIVKKRQCGGRKSALLGVAFVRRGRIAIDRAEIALAVDERQPHRKRLRHAHQRIINREVAVRMVLAHRIARDTRRFVIGAVRQIIVFITLKRGCAGAPASGRPRTSGSARL